ncbi:MULTISPECIES: hypothetical protein [Okeania]|uniref:hypothetical protein n=1 Tax=Okeania TaxID=1458928 RepID=UPI000F53AA96|nr:hypothetical protein [Okeania sp. SIO1F9]
MYDINLNYLGVNPPLAPPPPRRGRTESGVRREERRRKRNRRRDVAYLWDELYAWTKNKYEVLRMRFSCSKKIHPLIQQRLIWKYQFRKTRVCRKSQKLTLKF